EEDEEEEDEDEGEEEEEEEAAEGQGNERKDEIGCELTQLASHWKEELNFRVGLLPAGVKEASSLLLSCLKLSRDDLCQDGKCQFVPGESGCGGGSGSLYGEGSQLSSSASSSGNSYCSGEVGDAGGGRGAGLLINTQSAGCFPMTPDCGGLGSVVPGGLVGLQTLGSAEGDEVSSLGVCLSRNVDLVGRLDDETEYMTQGCCSQVKEGRTMGFPGDGSGGGGSNPSAGDGVGDNSCDSNRGGGGGSGSAGGGGGRGCGGGGKAKRVRTSFTPDQLAILQMNFELEANPDGQELERIANSARLNKRVTQVCCDDFLRKC
ncbi:unnamed protein product, partial [Protopolystoma xenopodis]